MGQRRPGARLLGWKGQPTTAGCPLPILPLLPLLPLLLVLLPSVTAASADSAFSSYLQGDGDQFQCFPPVDRSDCPHDSSLDAAAEAVVAIYRACTAMTQEPGTQQKYAVIGQYMAQGPHGLALVAAYAAAEGKQDLLKCTLKGFNEVSDSSEHQKQVVEKAIDQFFMAKDWKGSAENLYKLLHLDPRSIEAATEAYAFTERAGELQEFDSILRAAGEVIGGPHARARNRLADVDELVRRCEFGRANTALSNAAIAADNYCTAGGLYYRKMQKQLRCYRDRYYRQVVEMRDTPQQHQYHRDKRQLEREAGTLERGLTILARVRDKAKEVRRSEDYFAEMQRGYVRETGLLDGHLANGRLHDACQSLNKLRLAEEWAEERSNQCRAELGDDYRRQQQRLARHNRVRLAKVTLLLDAADKAVTTCSLDKAGEHLQALASPLDDVWEISGSGCAPPHAVAGLKARVAAVEKRLASARDGDCKRQASACPVPAGAVQRQTRDPYPHNPQTHQFYVKGEHRVGPYFVWYQQQGSQLAEQRCYDDQGRLTGTRTYWRADGTLREQGEYRDGRRNGVYTLYNAEGQPLEQAEYRDDRKHGKETIWFENGQRSRERHYVNDRLDGKALRWNIKGQLIEERHYRAGVEHGVRTDYKNGQVYWQVVVEDGVVDRYLIKRGKPVAP